MRNCCKCFEQIYDRVYLLAENQNWHFNCFCCHKCREPLASNGTYFSKDGMLLCRNDYYSLQQGPVCTECNYTLTREDYVHKIKLPCLPMQNSINERNKFMEREIYFHPSCFKCFKCQNFLRKGDKYIVKPDNSGVVCLMNNCANEYMPINSTINQTVPNVRKRGRQPQSNASSVKIKSEKVQPQFN